MSSSIKRPALVGGAAAIALTAAVGGAQAADFIAVPVPPAVEAGPVVVVPQGPVYVITVDGAASTSVTGGVDLAAVTSVDMRTASGWGFRLSVAGETFLDPGPVEGGLAFTGRVYRAFGDATVGVFAGTQWLWFGPPPADRGHFIGIDADYITDDVDVEAALIGIFDGMTYAGTQAILRTDLELGEHVEIQTLTALFKESGGPFGAVAAGRFGYQFGAFTPFVEASVGGAAGIYNWFATVGVDFEKNIGGGPLSVLAGGELHFSAGGFEGWEARIGLEYVLGGNGTEDEDEDAPIVVTANLGYVGGIGWFANIGIGLKFGEGRVRGFDFDGLGS